ncbi:hypothetical protein LAC81_36765 (plasmid) [Ensifer adhaerens]|uniref:hypothetical protein n=1 Tax=Ensifer adhaerens TaxID=106592 RepID=UPI001CBD06F3|nr:hypothetical protein [Ensifer adhaerens]MBZ7927492.1 hypothetical protein [Ensifer adhaerens]UAX97915.1 hypothetical protein LAC78_38070 [Ensifer adhaerens]UAY05294.1 hypothetical protein LAC80_36780 [Ensifer adhaerens]UAY12672.1 hypothetical protein LAC81_36765 [Ensifer adhaerens]
MLAGASFLNSEMMLFSGPFLITLDPRIQHATEFAGASRQMRYFIGATNTALLSTSSFLAAVAVEAARNGRTRPGISCSPRYWLFHSEGGGVPDGVCRSDPAAAGPRSFRLRHSMFSGSVRLLRGKLPLPREAS